MEKKREKDPDMHHYTTPLLKKSEDLKAEGFNESFVMTEEGLKASETGEIYKPQDLKIIKHYRFEGSSDPGDMTILYALETNTGKRGLVVDAYGTYSDADLGNFMKKVEEEVNRNNPGGNQYSSEEHQIFDDQENQ
jgi:hypothetical protein